MENKKVSNSKYFDWTLLIACILLTLIGMVFVVSANITSSSTAPMETFQALKKEIIIFAVSIVALVACYKCYRYRIAKIFYIPFAIFVLALLLSCLFFEAKNNARAWLYIGSFSLQPSEFTKSVMILVIAMTMTNQKEYKTASGIISFPIVLLLIYSVIILALQNDTGSAIALFAIAFFCLFIPGDKRLHDFRTVLLCLLALGIVGAVILCTPIGAKVVQALPFQDYQKLRFTVIYDPFEYFYDAGYQVCNSLIAFARGSITGVGLGNSVQKFGYLPYAESDFIIAVIAEEGGFLMLSVVFILYGIIIWRLMYHAFKTNREDEKVFFFGAASVLVIHILLNIGGATATIPLTGVPLVMLSAGGTSLINWYALLGVCLRMAYNYKRRMQ